MESLNAYRQSYLQVYGFLYFFLMWIVPRRYFIPMSFGSFFFLMIFVIYKIISMRRALQEIRLTNQEFSEKIHSFLSPVECHLVEFLKHKECVICLDDFGVQEFSMFTLHCSCKDAYYHEKCITQWLLKSATCPICRQDLKNRV